MITEMKIIDSTTVIYIYEQLNDTTGTTILSEVKEIIEENSQNNVLLNLKEVDYISSAGIRVLIKIKEMVEKNNKKLILCNMHPTVKNTLEIVDIISIFHILETEDQLFEMDI